jgi:hypothetical protein
MNFKLCLLVCPGKKKKIKIGKYVSLCRFDIFDVQPPWERHSELEEKKRRDEAKQKKKLEKKISPDDKNNNNNNNNESPYHYKNSKYFEISDMDNPPLIPPQLQPTLFSGEVPKSLPWATPGTEISLLPVGWYVLLFFWRENWYLSFFGDLTFVSMYLANNVHPNNNFRTENSSEISYLENLFWEIWKGNFYQLPDPQKYSNLSYLFVLQHPNAPHTVWKTTEISLKFCSAVSLLEISTSNQKKFSASEIILSDLFLKQQNWHFIPTLKWSEAGKISILGLDHNPMGKYDDQAKKIFQEISTAGDWVKALDYVSRRVDFPGLLFRQKINTKNEFDDVINHHDYARVEWLRYGIRSISHSLLAEIQHLQDPHVRKNKTVQNNFFFIETARIVVSLTH